MECPNCQNENPEGANFCNNCATPFGGADHGNKFSLISDYTPPELKERILQAGKQIESERKFVTILFADVAGFTSLSEKLDPETVTMVMNDLFNGLISIIIKYEGLIIDFFGDGILAVFGAPIAHENDPERAVRSVNEMMPYVEQFNKISPYKLPEPLGMHAGIHSGLVVVGNVGNDLRMRYSAVGDTVNLCSRIADHATRGEIYISENTYKLITSLIDTEPPETIKVKGKEYPVKVYKFRAIKGEPAGKPLSGEEGFVGRRKEKEIISQALELVLKKEDQRILVCGDPGVGKSRLKNELVKTAFSKGLIIFECKCSSFETKTPYYLWNTLLKNMLHIPFEASESEIKRLLHDSLAILKMDDEEPYLAALLSLRYEEILLEDDQERRRRIFEAVYTLVDKLGRRSPAVFILEDMHWADRFSKELLEFLMQKDEFPPSLFYIIFRPEYTEYKSMMNRGQLINLDRMAEEDILELIKLRLNVNSVPDELMELIKKRTEGNPFFIEESLKTLVEKGLISVKKGKVKLLSDNLESEVPDTVQGTVMARIDRLEGRIREVLLNASVIGREFSRRLVERVTDRKEDVSSHLSHLKRLEFILEKEEVQEFEYLFKHYMIQEVAYNTILINKRKKLHGLIAKAIEEIYHDRLKGLYELLAFHYEKAENWQKAAEYYGRAGRKAREIYTEEESKHLFDRKNYVIEKLYVSRPGKKLFQKIIWAGIGILVLFRMKNVFWGYFTGPHTPSRRILKPIIQLCFTDPSTWTNWNSLSLSFNILMLIIVALLLIDLLLLFGTKMFHPVRLYEVLSDRLEIVNKNNKRFSIPFSNIESIAFGFYEKFGLMFKEANQYTSMDEYKKLTLFQPKPKLNPAFPYSIGVGGKGSEGICICRKSGYRWLKYLMPWLHTLEKSRDYVFHTKDSREFFDQLFIAYEKWKRQNLK